MFAVVGELGPGRAYDDGPQLLLVGEAAALVHDGVERPVGAPALARVVQVGDGADVHRGVAAAAVELGAQLADGGLQGDALPPTEVHGPHGGGLVVVHVPAVDVQRPVAQPEQLARQALVRQLLQLLDGTVAVVSEVGEHAASGRGAAGDQRHGRLPRGDHIQPRYRELERVDERVGAGEVELAGVEHRDELGEVEIAPDRLLVGWQRQARIGHVHRWSSTSRSAGGCSGNRTRRRLACGHAGARGAGSGRTLARVSRMMAALAAVVALLAACGSGPPPRSAPPSAPMSSAAPLPASPSASAPSASAEITLAFGGDVHFAGRNAALLRNPATAFGPIASVLQSADLAMVNMETAITSRGAEEPKTFHFRGPAAALDAARAAGVDVLTFANNHVLDYGQVGLADTIDAARAASFPIVGIGRDA